MIKFEGPPAHTASHRQRVSIDGRWHLLVPLDSLEGIAWDAPGSITYPDPAPGWATTSVGTTRFAAWFEGGRQA